MRKDIDHQAALCREVGGSVDGRLLAAFVNPAPGERLAELGVGCGEVTFLVAQSAVDGWVDGLELQPELVEVARYRLASLPFGHRVRVWQGDVRSPPKEMLAGGYDRVFSNPPFFKKGSGRLPPDRRRAMARFEQAGTLADFIGCGAVLLRQEGVFCLIHRPERLDEILATLRQFGLSPTRLLPVCDQPGGPEVLVLIAAKKGGSASLEKEPPWIITQWEAQP
ncbi:MAG: methyltransferase [Magnetococcales bacterium]|nr:methyltransferase [Magnetococcales bacterium]